MADVKIEAAPNAIELQEFQFKLFSRLRIFPEESAISLSDNLNLVCSASKYGLLFVGSPSGFQVLQTAKLIELQDSKVKSRNELCEFPRREIFLQSQPSHIGVSCDGEFLAVIFTIDSCHVIRVYHVPSFFSQSVRVLHEVRATSDSSIQVSGFCWNPGVPNFLALCFNDGSICVYEFKETSYGVNSAPAEARATCLCWSPKGKQIVVGSFDGTLTQYKPELKAVKQLSAPKINQHAVSVVSVQWLSNYQFAAVYRDVEDINERPALMLVNAPKSGPQTFINYEDICYSTGNLRPPQFYLEHIQPWKVLLVGAGNSIEVGVLGCQNRTSEEWNQWVQEDASRADLPLTKSHQETFPVGLTIDTSAQYCLTYSENQRYPPMPFLCLYSHDGLLCLYFIVNLLENAEQICSPPLLPPDQSGLPLFINMVSLPKAAAAIESSQNDNVPVAQVAPLLETSALVSGGLQAPITSSGFPSFFGEAKSSQPNWMATTPLQKFENKDNKNSSIENITPPNSRNEVTPASGTGGASMFGGTSSVVSLQKIPHQQETTPLQPQTSQPFLQAPQKSSTNLSFGFSTGTPSFFSGGAGSGNSSPGFGKLLAPSPASCNIPNSNNMTSPPASVPLSQSVQINQPPYSSPVASIPASSVQQVSPLTLPSNTQEVTGAESVQDTVMIREEVVNAAIIEEVAHFDAELKELFGSFRNMDIKIGEDLEKNEINSTLDSFDEFWNEVKETTNCLKNEVDALKNTMLETFCYVEDAKARLYQCQNSGYKKLVFSQELDPVSQRRLNNINQNMFYIGNQIKEANRVIDDRWHAHKDKVMISNKSPLRIPPREELYQTLLLQNNIINKHKFIMEDIQNRIKQRNSKLESHVPLLTDLDMKKNEKFTKGNMELSKLAENLLQVKLNEREFSKLSTTGKGQLNKNEDSLTEEDSLISEEKKNLLRQIHNDVFSSIPKVRVARPYSVSKSSGVIPFTSPKTTASETGHLSPGEKLLQKYLKSGLNKFKADAIGLRNLSESSVVKNPDSLFKTDFTAPRSVAVKNIATYLETSSAAFLNQNHQKDAMKPINNQTTDLVKPVAFQPSAISLSPKVETNKIDMCNKENISKNSSSMSFDRITEKKAESDLLKNPSRVPSFVPSVLSSSDGDKSKTDQEQKSMPPLLSMNKIVSSVEDSVNTVVTSQPQTGSDNIFSGFGFNAQSSSTSLFNFTTNAARIKEGNQDQAKPQTIFGDAFNKSQAAKQNTESSDGNAFSFASSGLFKGVNLPPSSSSTPNTSLTSSISFGNEELLQNKQIGSIFGGKSSLASVNTDFGKSSTFSLSSVPQDQPQKSEEVTKNDTKPAIIEEPVLDQTSPMSKPGSLFGGTTAPTSAPPSTFTFGSGKTSFGVGSLSTTTAGQLSFSYGSSLTTTAASGNSLITAEPAFTYSFSSAASSIATTTTSVSTIFAPPTTTISADSSGLTASTGSSSSKFSFSSTWADSAEKPLNFDSNSSSQTSVAMTATANVPDNGNITPAISTTVTPLIPSGVAVPVMTSASVIGATVDSSSDNLLELTTSTPVSTATSSTQKNQAPATTIQVSASEVATAVTSSIVSSINGNETEPTAIAVPVNTTTSVIAKSSLGSGETAATTVGPSSANTFSFGNHTVSTTISSTSTTASTVATEFSFAASMISTMTADSGTKMALAFGQSSGTLGTSLFGGNTSSMGATQATNIFGQVAQQATVSTASSTPFSFTLSPDSGQQPSSTTSSFFGNKSLFGSTPIAPATTTTTTFFGQPVSTPAATTSSNIFSQSLAAPSQSPFEQTQPSSFGSPTFGSKPTFGQSGASLFGQTPSGSFVSNSGFGGPPVFGSTPTTPDNSAQAGGLFQTPGSGGGLFGARANTSGSPGGSFSTGGQTISQTGFGPPAAFQTKPAGFGSSPPAFGSAPSFGGAPTFGGSPTFGTPGKVFGNASPPSGFGSGSQQSTTFENLASQNTMSFGNLAQTQQQHQQQPPPPPPSFGSGGSLFGGATQANQAPAPAFPPTTFGGNSFTSWR